MRVYWLFLIISIKTCFGERNLDFTYETAKDLSGLPLECYDKYYPFKFSQVWNNASDVSEHTNYIPIFAGCFDWHSRDYSKFAFGNLLKIMYILQLSLMEHDRLAKKARY